LKFSVSNLAPRANEVDALVGTDELGRRYEADHDSFKGAGFSRDRHTEPPEEGIASIDCYELQLQAYLEYPRRRYLA
jgi:hypothetical protein